MDIRRITKFLVILSFFLTIIITGCEEFGGGKQKEPNKIVYPKCESGGNCLAPGCDMNGCWGPGCYSFLGMDTTQGCEKFGGGLCSACTLDAKKKTLAASPASVTYYTITYIGNGNTGGDVPTDLLKYTQGQNITIRGNPQNLVKTGYSFAGWNTMADGSGTTYTQGQIFTMTFSANILLFAMWSDAPTYTITYNGNGNTGGSVPVDTTNYIKDQVLTILGNAQNLTKTGNSFTGWNTTSDGTGTNYYPGQILTMGTDNIILFAMWGPPRWTQLLPSGFLPSARSGHTAIYDNNGNMIIFGGVTITPYQFLNDLWRYNISSNSWTQLSPSATLPSARQISTAIYDGNGNMIIFGGYGVGNTYFNDIWKYNITSNSWEKLSPSDLFPSSRYGHTAIYDGNGNMIIFGGVGGFLLYFNDIWKYNITSNSWTQLFPSGLLPIGRVSHSAIYDGNGNMIIFGGTSSQGQYLNDIWKYNIYSNSWTQLSTSGNSPSARMFPSAIYDGNGNMFIFGGYYYNGNIGIMFNDIWKYNIFSNSWVQLFPSASLPEGRYKHTAIFDGNGSMIIFGGAGGNLIFNDLWKY